MSNNKNPFESGNNTSPFESGQTSDYNKARSKKQRKSKAGNYNNSFNSKSKRKPLIVILVILAIVAIILAANWWKISMYMHDLETIRDVEDVEIVEDYTFDAADVKDEQYAPLLDLTIGQGTEFGIDQSDEAFYPNADGGVEASYIVGRDIEPGIYTLTVSGDGYLNMDTTIHQYFDIPNEGESSYYNIPLAKGDKIEITTFREGSTVSLDLTVQDKYVEYEAGTGMQGIYVYGLSNFNSQVELDSDDYASVLYAYPDADWGDYLTTEYLYDQDVTLNGGVSTYFVIQ